MLIFQQNFKTDYFETFNYEATFCSICICGRYHVRRQKKASKSKSSAAAQATPPAKKPGKDDIQPYYKVITKEAKTDNGLFKVHFLDDKYFFEIPDSLLEREMLMVTRIAKNTSNNRFWWTKNKYTSFTLAKKR